MRNGAQKLAVMEAGTLPLEPLTLGKDNVVRPPFVTELVTVQHGSADCSSTPLDNVAFSPALAAWYASRLG